jgi:hypothetical protein
MECANCDRLNKQAREAIREHRKRREVNRAATVRLDAAVNEERRLKSASVGAIAVFRTHRAVAHPDLHVDAAAGDPDLAGLLYGGDPSPS